MSKLLYIATHGTDDATKATLPFLMAKGALDAGHDTGIILMGVYAVLDRLNPARHKLPSIGSVTSAGGALTAMLS